MGIGMGWGWEWMGMDGNSNRMGWGWGQGGQGETPVVPAAQRPQRRGRNPELPAGGDREALRGGGDIMGTVQGCGILGQFGTWGQFGAQR